MPTRSLVARVRAVLKRINTCSRNYLADDPRPCPRLGRASRRPSLAYFLPPERPIVSKILVVEDSPD